MVAAKVREDRALATGPNQTWAMDRMYDQLFDGRRIWVLTMLDTWSRICPELRVCRITTAWEVISAVDEAVRWFGQPKIIRVDHGCQFTSRKLDLWVYSHEVTRDFSRPGKPIDNTYIESFNARVRTECLYQNWFTDLDDARRKVEDWRVDYNKVRPHSAIGDMPPMALLGSIRNFVWRLTMIWKETSHGTPRGIPDCRPPA